MAAGTGVLYPIKDHKRWSHLGRVTTNTKKESPLSSSLTQLQSLWNGPTETTVRTERELRAPGSLPLTSSCATVHRAAGTMALLRTH